jgi:hypothetical protein
VSDRTRGAAFLVRPSAQPKTWDWLTRRSFLRQDVHEHPSLEYVGRWKPMCWMTCLFECLLLCKWPILVYLKQDLEAIRSEPLVWRVHTWNIGGVPVAHPHYRKWKWLTPR